MSEKPNINISKLSNEDISDYLREVIEMSFEDFLHNPYGYIKRRMDMVYAQESEYVKDLIVMLDSIKEKRISEDTEIPNPYLKIYFDKNLDYRDRIVSLIKLAKISGFTREKFKAYLEEMRQVDDLTESQEFKLKTIESVVNEIYGDEE